jgi:hypothetical protein
MTQSIVSAQDADKLSLSINGKPHTYTNDKAGKRQAILDGLNAIETITSGTDVYLPSDEALQWVATVLYPNGIQTEAEYQTVCQVTEKACAFIGYGDEIELGPPTVPFAARGAYRKRYPPVDSELIFAELAQAHISRTYPRRKMAGTILWNEAGLAVYGRRWNYLSPAQQTQIQIQVDTIVEQAGWQKLESESACLYFQPLSVNEAGARTRLLELLRHENGGPISHTSLVYQVQVGAYGHGFFTNELDPVLQTIVTDTLVANGYNPDPDNGEYRPKPLTLDLPELDTLVTRLNALQPITTEMGQGLLLSDLMSIIVDNDHTPSQWQMEQLVQTDPVSQALRRLGYQTALTWCQPYQFQPKREDNQTCPLLLKEVRVKNDLNRKITLAKGFSVFTPSLTIDDGEDTLVYLEMVGAKESVKANWAALVGGNRVHWFSRQRIQMEGMKQHVKMQATLPCGWVSQILLHKQASLKEMNPEQPFYLLDDGTQPIPPQFYAMLNSCLALPLLLSWAYYLWDNGREQQLITLLQEGEGQGYAAWRVLPAAEAWQAVIQQGLKEQVLSF